MEKVNAVTIKEGLNEGDRSEASSNKISSVETRRDADQ